MHQTNRKRQCFICFKDLRLENTLIRYIHPYPICLDCLRQFEIVDIYVMVSTVRVRILYRYNDFFKQLLYQYKGLDDLALKEVFFACFPELKKEYRNYVVVTIPSRQLDNARRGFQPSVELAKELGTTIFDGLYKNRDYKQTEQKDRGMIHQVMQIERGDFLKGKDVLILDDVMTSSHTMQAAIALVQSCHPHSVQGLVLSTPSLQQFALSKNKIFEF